MKVLHVNATQLGGAALCAIRINNALKNEGIETQMLFAEGDSMPNNVEGAIANTDKHPFQFFFSSRLRVLLKSYSPFVMNYEKMLRLVYTHNTENLCLHIPFSQFKNIANHPLIEWADIIHLHWVSGFIDYPSFFIKVKKPIVWTLHDKYPAVGLHHYSSEFHPIPKELKKLDDYCRKIKRESLAHAKNLNVVAISKMMVDICQKSDVLKNFPITLIYNGIDANVFQRYDKQKARKELGLLPQAKIFLFSAYNIHDPNKGLSSAIEALEQVDEPNKMLVCIGMSNEPIMNASFPIILSGYLTSYTRISKYYTSADFFLMCSYEETFAQAPMEAMACGTPVVSFPCSGIHDLINSDNGVICTDFSVRALVNGIKSALNNHYIPEIIRKDVVCRFSYEKIAKQYVDLYNNILNDKR